MYNVLITGSNGQLGQEIFQLRNEYSNLGFTFTDVEELDITDFNAVESIIICKKIDVIINCAAYTAVDKAEEEIENALKVNSIGVEILAKVAFNNNCKLVHVSTDYVYPGNSFLPYKEADDVAPLGVYGSTKLDGERRVNLAGCDSIIIRTSWLYSSFGNNFVKTIVKLGEEKDELKVIFDQVGTPTYAKDLALTIMNIVSKNCHGIKGCEIYNYSNEGVASWYDFAKEILNLCNIQTNVIPVESNEFKTLATRPNYSVLNKSKIKNQFGLIIPYWKESLGECLKILNN